MIVESMNRTGQINLLKKIKTFKLDNARELSRMMNVISKCRKGFFHQSAKRYFY